MLALASNVIDVLVNTFWLGPGLATGAVLVGVGVGVDVAVGVGVEVGAVTTGTVPPSELQSPPHHASRTANDIIPTRIAFFILNICIFP